MQGEHERKLLKNESKMRWKKEERWFNRTGRSNRYKEELIGLCDKWELYRRKKRSCR